MREALKVSYSVVVNGSGSGFELLSGSQYAAVSGGSRTVNPDVEEGDLLIAVTPQGAFHQEADFSASTTTNITDFTQKWYDEDSGSYIIPFRMFKIGGNGSININVNG